MWNNILTVIKATRQVLASKKRLAIFLSFASVIFWLFLYIPVRNIPGNDFAFQASILTAKDWLLLLTISLLTALSLVMNLYILGHKIGVSTSIATVGSGGLGGGAGVIASVFGTATCAACVFSLFGFLGVGGVLFLIKYRIVITAATIGLMLVSLHFTAQRVLGICNECIKI